MARQLILFSCLLAVVFSSLNCYPSGPAIDGACPSTDYKLYGSICYKCSEGNLPSTCQQAGPIIGSPCPEYDMIIQYGLGKTADPFNTGMCAKCPASG